MTLNEKRKELKRRTIDWWFSEKCKMNKITQKVLNVIFKEIEKQDKEFIKELKEEFKHHLDCADVDGRRIVYHMTDKDYDEFFEIIDKIAGEELV